MYVNSVLGFLSNLQPQGGPLQKPPPQTESAAAPALGSSASTCVRPQSPAPAPPPAAAPTMTSLQPANGVRPWRLPQCGVAGARVRPCLLTPSCSRCCGFGPGLVGRAGGAGARDLEFLILSGSLLPNTYPAGNSQRFLLEGCYIKKGEKLL